MASGSFVTHLESTADGSHVQAGTLQTVHGGRPLLVRYDLDAVRGAVTPEEVATREATLWRYRELLPLPFDAAPVTLGERMSPLLHCPRLGAELGALDLWIKDEAQLPTGSFKARGMAMAVSMAQQLGVRRVAVPSAGNAGGALAAYAARAGIECFVFLPQDTPAVNRYEAVQLGARVFLVDGLIGDCAALVRAGQQEFGWFDVSTLREPYRIEGKKTMGLELAEQLGWELPDVILYPTGGGTGLIGMHKAFAELAELGWLRGTRRPRFYACQSDGCAPLPAAFAAGAEHGIDPQAPHTVAAGLRVPRALGDFLVLRAVRESGGAALAARESELLPWLRRAASREGISLCPESAACLDVLARCLDDGTIRRDERIVLFNTGAMQKYVEALAVELPRLSKSAPDWGVVREAGTRGL